MAPVAPRRLVWALWTLLALFVVRVLSQMLVTTGWVTFLPPMEAWQSGLLPYPWLVVCQLLVLALYSKICTDLTRGRGFFATPCRPLGTGLLVFGSLYFGVMVVRFCTMLSHEGAWWMGGPIPIIFHWILATFLLVVGGYHRAGHRE
jgi:uncharacterized protein